MATSKKIPDAPAPNPAKKPAPTGRGRWMLLAVVALLLLGGAYAAWPSIGPRVMGSPHYQLEPKDIVLVQAQPAWIKADVRAESLKAASVDGPVSVLDADLTARLHKAFSLHPWVAQVTRVRKFATPRVEIDLKYRRPVLMVEVPGGLYAVDGEGVLLPSADFTAEEARHYPRLSGARPVTEGPVGTPWHDAHVAGAARIADTLVDDWKALGLVRIVPTETPASEDPPSFELRSAAGARAIWGTAESKKEEAAATEKLARLKELVERYGSLDKAASQSPAADGAIDLRTKLKLTELPHPAR